MNQEIYCEIVGKAVGLFKNKVEIEVDFGQEKAGLEVAIPWLTIKVRL